MLLREELTPTLQAEIQPLLKAHWREIAHFQDIPLNVCWEVYYHAMVAGMLRVFTARETRSPKRLAGYAVFFVRPNPHFQDSTQAVQDVMFMLPACRGHGGALITFAEHQLKAEGVQAVYHHVKRAFDFGSLLARLGYSEVERIWVKRLDS